MFTDAHSDPRAIGAGRWLPRARAALRTIAAVFAALLLPLAGAAAQSTEATPKGGLFFKTNKPGEYYEAPLVDTDVHLAVAGTILRATVRQHFVNPSNAWLEGVYVFPLPEQAAVDHLVMEIGQRRVLGQIKERQEAKRVYEEAAANGQRASLVESERPNVFTTSVANILPGQAITVEIEYQDNVGIDAGTYSLRFPMVVGPRYIPGGPVSLVSDHPEGTPPAPVGTGWAQNTDQVPDASRITPPVIQPGQGKISPVRLAIDFAPGFATDRVASLFHPVVVTAKDDGTSTITLADGDVPADRDFVLEWTAKPAAAPMASLFAEQRGADVYLFGVMTPGTGDSTAPARLPRDITFVIDTSGSMGGPSIEQARRALSLALDRLTADDRFNVIQFNSRTDALFPSVQPWNVDTLRHAQAYVNALYATDGTEMEPALHMALAEPAPPGRLKQVVFLTDAAVGNEAQLFDDIARQLGNARLFTIGIGSAPNSYFMRKAAELGRGSFTYIGDIAEVGERMNDLLRKLDEPALTDIALTWPAGPASAVETYPATIPDLYQGQPVTFSARLPNATLATLAGRLALDGRTGNSTWHRDLDLVQVRAGAGIAAVWARAKLSAIEDAQWRGADPAAVRAEATKHALAYELVSAYTSLVAVDQEVVRPRDQALDTQAVATNLPQGWQYGKVFGPTGGETQPTTLPQPETLMRKIDFQGAPGDSMTLPKTATPALLHLLIGGVLMALALAALCLGRPRATMA